MFLLTIPIYYTMNMKRIKVLILLILYIIIIYIFRTYNEQANILSLVVRMKS